MSGRSESAPRELEADVASARGGDRAALERVMEAAQRDVYNLALRFLWHPADAEDATQEILVRILTGLGGFRGESGFRTWVYRVACNRLLTLRRGRMEERAMSFAEFGEDLASGLETEDPVQGRGAEAAVLLEEVKIGCTLGMLLCLDRAHRLAYILGEILELDHHEAAAVLEIAPAAYRKRLSRARAAIVAFTGAHCGLVDPGNRCRCAGRVATAVRLGRVDPRRPLFAGSADAARRFPRILDEIRRLEGTRRAAALYRSHPEAVPSAGFSSWLRGALEPES